MSLRAPIGVSDFRSLREQGLYYVDKTALLRDLIDTGTQVLLLPRPRRFGKTLNLSTMRWFFERRAEDLSSLFEGLAIWDAGADYRRHFQRHPVIFISFKDVKEKSFAECLVKLKRTISAECRRHTELLEGDLLSPAERSDFELLLGPTGDTAAFEDALRSLSLYLTRLSGQQAVILIDEYDTPINAGHTHGYYDEVTGFLRSFLSAGLKDNENLYKGVLTGILRVARESIFSGLNNIAVHSIVSPKFATAFGFTEPEVAALLGELRSTGLLEEIQRWYNGYLFGGQVVYNPWSILNFAEAPERGVRPYWVFTSSEDVLRRLVLERGFAVSTDFEALLKGGAVRKELDEHIVLRDLTQKPEAVWSLLYFSGYLTARNVELQDGATWGDLYIPNREVRYVFDKSIAGWTESGAGGAQPLAEMLRAMLSGDVARFERILSDLVKNTISYHDTRGRNPERVYQAFVLGALVGLGRDYEVRSNREAGFGRYDVMVLPRIAGRSGVVFEFKEADSDDPAVVDRSLARALEQIAALDYTTELRARGASPIWGYAVVFDGKRVWVRASEQPISG